MVEQVPRSGRDPAMRWGFGGFAAGFVVALGVTLGVLALDGLARDRDVVSQVRQSAGVKYPDKAGHVAVLWSVRSFVFKRREPYELLVGTTPTYGHRLKIDARGTGGPQAIVSTAWDPRGVLVRLRSGHEVFVPARYFLYGR
jgi:hypothetical protein